VNRGDISELHNIAAIGDVCSILRYGILSHVLAEKVEHESLAMPEIQERRKNKNIPGARKLHEYVNLYFDAHNPMLSKCREYNDRICVLQITPEVLDLQGVIITDRNAASEWVRFWPVDTGLQNIDRGRIVARYWTHPDNPIEESRHKSEKCAEVLIPDRVDVQYITGAYVANHTALQSFERLNTGLQVQIDNSMFF